MQTVFEAFPEGMTEYTFLQISRGGVAGDRIVNQTVAKGLFKHRTGMVVGSDQETKQSAATLKVRPTESFVGTNNGNMVGHGIRYEGKDYQITGQTQGKNYENGQLEHYSLTLGAADFSDYEAPL